MNLLVLTIVLVVSSTTLILGVIALVTNSKQTANRFFAILCAASACYTVVNFLSDNDQTLALFWSRSTFAAAVLMFTAVQQFLIVFPRRTASILLQLETAGLAVIVGAICYAPGFVTGVKLSPRHTDVVIGSLYPVFISYVIVAISFTAWLAVTGYRRSARLDRERSRYMIIGLFLTATVLLTTNFVLPLLTGTNKLSGIGSYVFSIFAGFSFYAIIRHRFLDVRRLVARSVTYLALLLSGSIMYVSAAFIVSHFLFQDSGSFGQTLVYATLSIILAFAFQPLRRGFEHLTNNIFYHDQYNARQVLDGISRILVSELNLDRLMSRSLDTLCRQMKLEFGQLVIFNDNRVYRIEHFGPLPKRLMIVPELRRLGTGQLVADELMNGERKSLLDDHGIRVSLGLKSGDEFVGYLLLGDRLSGDSYGKADLELLGILGKELAVGISNAKAYAEIQEFNKTLQDKVEHATGRLRVANRHLKELDKTKDEFISMASHQLRTPLTTIKGYLSMMTEGDAGKLSATQTEFVGYAFDASERMVNLISDLLNVSRLEAGRFLIQTKPTDVSAMVADEVRQLQQHAINKGLELTYVPPTGDLPLVELDEGKTRQVIMNFIDNAIYYTKSGGVTVRVSKHDDNVRLEVTDTGIGVPDVAKSKLFSKFFRAENAQGVRPDGTGLGLYLARRVIADQNGTIIFRSSEGHGSTFGFELPIKRASGKVK